LVDAEQTGQAQQRGIHVEVDGTGLVDGKPVVNTRERLTIPRAARLPTSISAISAARLAASTVPATLLLTLALSKVRDSPSLSLAATIKALPSVRPSPRALPFP